MVTNQCTANSRIAKSKFLEEPDLSRLNYIVELSRKSFRLVLANSSDLRIRSASSSSWQSDCLHIHAFL
ncbi:hypothetical protein Y032_0280g1214 [Ancylostoma ceylanicum]|uniref:Uncharacterized protein n=1 Tax=Ancylostoma ceylanicum TaxID=53326 RepID=A0A016S7W7_9BILA|nr:hypothetical protein Y032_0280g1214 [Ancylostoma ceylanicum]